MLFSRIFIPCFQFSMSDALHRFGSWLLGGASPSLLSQDVIRDAMTSAQVRLQASITNGLFFIKFTEKTKDFNAT